MLSHPLYHAWLNPGMRNPFQKSREDDLVCKECKMSFGTKESLERHKKKAKHFGAVHLS